MLYSNQKAEYHDLEFGSDFSTSSYTIPLIVISFLKVFIRYENVLKNPCVYLNISHKSLCRIKS